MSDLKDRLRSDLTASIKARDALRSSTLRMLLSAITNAEVAGKESRELSDDDIVGVLSTEAKKRREAATAFSDAGRIELADKETAEAAVIADYLPEQLDAGTIAGLVTAAITQTGAAGEGVRAMGRGMGALQRGAGGGGGGGRGGGGGPAPAAGGRPGGGGRGAGGVTPAAGRLPPRGLGPAGARRCARRRCGRPLCSRRCSRAASGAGRGC